MKRMAILLVMAAGLSLGATTTIQCDLGNLFNFVRPNLVTIEYVNDAIADVDVVFRYLKDDDKDKNDLEDDGNRIDSLVPLGGVVQFELDCDRAGSLMIDYAKLKLLGDIGPTKDTDDYHRGDDYACGDIVTFTFSNSLDLTQLYIDVNSR